MSALRNIRAYEISVPAHLEDLATAALWECGTTGIEVRSGPRRRSVLLAYFPARRGLAARVRSALASVPRAKLKRVPVPRVDWVARVRDEFRPLAAGGFSIVPSWLRSTPAPAGAAGARIVVEPGRAFGTGTHATTRLCLLALEQLAGEAPLGRVADLGTGTGILSIAALRLGARSAAGVENDPDALVSARRHASLNKAPLRLVQGDLARPLRRGRFDTIVANLIASMLHNRAGEILALAAPRARLVLSGILAEQVPRLKRTYRGKGRLRVLREGEWAALVLRTGRA